MNMFDELKRVDPDIGRVVENELRRQQEQLVLIASENIVSVAGLAAQGSVLTNKYAEGYPGRRWYGGCRNVDAAEILAIRRAMKLFGAEYANVQPHSGTQANMAVYNVILEPGDVMLSMDLMHGGHLSHGNAKNFSGRTYKIVFYGVDRETEIIDYDEVERLARTCRPRLIIAGSSSYPRTIDFERFGMIAREVGAYFMADIAHIAGLVAAGIHPSPVEYADFVTGTTHKTLRGTRGGFVLCKEDFAKRLDDEVFPGMQGGPLMHAVAGKAVAFLEASTEEFREYQARIVENAGVLASEIASRGYRLISGGTDNHMFLIDLGKNKITGIKAEGVLGDVGVIVNKNVIPFEPRSPFNPSGIRIGTPTVTSRGMGKTEMTEIAECIDLALSEADGSREEAARRVKDLCLSFPIYEGLLEDAVGVLQS